MTHMTSNIARTTAGAPLNREEATRVVNTVSHKIIDVLCHQPANTSINLDTIATMFCQKKPLPTFRPTCIAAQI